MKNQQELETENQALREERNALQKQLACARQWRKCSTHGEIDGATQWGCPDCVAVLRRERNTLEAQLAEARQEIRLECFVDEDGDSVIRLRGVDGWHFAGHGETFKEALMCLAQFIVMEAEEKVHEK